MKLHVLVAFLALIISTGCSARKVVPLGEIPPFQPPNESVVSSTKNLMESDMTKEQIAGSTKGPLAKRSKNIVDRLTRAGGFGNYSIPVYVVDSEEGDVNAMAVNGSVIVVYDELLKKVKSDEELSVVLSHEIAHILARHHEDEGEKDRSTGVSIFSTLLGTAASVATTIATGSSGLGDVAGDVTGVTASTIGEGAIVKAYSRDMESEADHVGLVLMARAGYDPNTAIVFWSRADEVFGDSGGGGLSSFLSTHPSGDDRVEHLREALPYAMSQYQPPKSQSKKNK